MSKPSPSSLSSSVAAAAAAAATLATMSSTPLPSSTSEARTVVKNGFAAKGPFSPSPGHKNVQPPQVPAGPVNLAIAKRSRDMRKSVFQLQCTICFKGVKSAADLRRCDNALPAVNRDDPATACQEFVCKDCRAVDHDFACTHDVTGSGICICADGAHGTPRQNEECCACTCEDGKHGTYGANEECPAFKDFAGWDGEALYDFDEFVVCARCQPDIKLQAKCMCCAYNGDNFVHRCKTVVIRRPFRTPYHEAVARRLVLIDLKKAAKVVANHPTLHEELELEDTAVYFEGKHDVEPYGFVCFSCYDKFNFKPAVHDKYTWASSVGLAHQPLDMKTLRLEDGSYVPVGIWSTTKHRSTTSSDDALVFRSHMDTYNPRNGIPPPPALLNTGWYEPLRCPKGNTNGSPVGNLSTVIAAVNASNPPSPPETGTGGSAPSSSSSSSSAPSSSSSSISAPSSSSSATPASLGASSSSSSSSAAPSGASSGSSSSSAAVEGGKPDSTGTVYVWWRNRLFEPGTEIDGKKHSVVKYRPEVPNDNLEGEFYRDEYGGLRRTNPSGRCCEHCDSMAEWKKFQYIKCCDFSGAHAAYKRIREDCHAIVSPEDDEDDDKEDLQVCAQCLNTSHYEGWGDFGGGCTHCDAAICPTCIEENNMCKWCEQDDGEGIIALVDAGGNTKSPSVHASEAYDGPWPLEDMQLERGPPDIEGCSTEINVLYPILNDFPKHHAHHLPGTEECDEQVRRLTRAGRRLVGGPAKLKRSRAEPDLIAFATNKRARKDDDDDEPLVLREPRKVCPGAPKRNRTQRRT